MTSLTYEKLFEILRIEKNRPELQELDQDFFDACESCLYQAKQHVGNGHTEDGVHQHIDRHLVQLDNIKRMIKELYDRRERKIVDLAINVSRTSVQAVKTINLLETEQALFDSISGNLLHFRKNCMHILEHAQAPKQTSDELDALDESDAPDSGAMISTDGSVEGHESAVEDSAACQEDDPLNAAADDQSSTQANEAVGVAQPEARASEANSHAVPQAAAQVTGDQQTDAPITENSAQETSESDATSADKPSPFFNEAKDGFATVMIMQALDQVVGPDLQIYGPYEPNMTVELPSVLAGVLVDKGQAKHA